ncbi:MAG: spore cortex biosynthesis protein YabQ [Lachnospiraceae bacterium]|nr:spore cortex biosynthesis protein YabQ [Lachnospiraceae bacterium]
MMGVVSETIAGEGSLLFVSFLFGIALMMLYDIFRIFRHIVKHGTILLAVEDVCYWFLCAIGIFAMLYEENDGLLRWFVLGGVALGMLLENILISPFVIRFFVKIIRVWLGIFGKVFHVVQRPGRKVFSWIRKEYRKIRKAVKIGLSKE